MIFYHPKKYKELHGLTSRKCNTRQRSLGGLPVNGALNSDQVISKEPATAGNQRAPGPGLKLQAREDSTANSTRGQVAEPQASSDKPQAPSDSSNKPQASSPKQQASSSKPQAASSKI